MTEKRKRMKKSVVILRLLGYLWKYKGWLCLAGFLVFAANLIALKGPELSGKAIDAIVGKGNVDFPLVYRYAFQMLLVYLISAALSYLLALVMIHISKKVVYIMRRQVFEHLID